MKIKIIAEIGINHNGDIELAKKMISSAKNCGADIVKFQKRDINLVYSKEQLSKFRESPWGTTEKEQKEGLEFDQKEYEIINDYCNELKLEWLASAWDKESINFLNQFNLRIQKVPSALIVDEAASGLAINTIPAIKAITAKPIIAYLTMLPPKMFDKPVPTPSAAVATASPPALIVKSAATPS